MLSALLTTVFLGLVFLAAWMPFVFESSSILYKFGMDRLLLRTGQICGNIAFLMLLAQLFLAARIRLLDRLAGLPRLMVIHRINGLCAAFLVVAHPGLLLAAGELNSLRLGMEYWPEGVGVLLAVTVLITLGTAFKRERIALPFHLWRRGHGVGASLIIFMAAIHVLFVGGGFSRETPRAALLILLAVSFVLWAVLRMRRLFAWGQRYQVRSVQKAAENAWDVRVQPERQKGMDFFPGQFAFIRVFSPHLSSEEHPFTIASSPLEKDSMSFTIRGSGDWTAHVGSLAAGDKVLVSGPFGLFSPYAHDVGEDLVLVAGGVGITPFLSFLRTMKTGNVSAKVTLVWSNRTRAQAPCAEEIDALERDLPDLEVVRVYTREPAGDGKRTRLGRSVLESIFAGTRSTVKTRFYLCGPRGMMDAIYRLLRDMDVPRDRIVLEEFRL